MVRLGKIFLLNCLAIHVIALDVIKPLTETHVCQMSNL